MKIAFFSTHKFEIDFFTTANQAHHFELSYFDSVLQLQTVPLAVGFPCVCCFVTDRLDAATLRGLGASGVKLIALRSAGYNHVDLEEADRLGLTVVRVPAYSPHSVAEHAVGLLISLNRKIHKAYARVREQNFSLEGLMGFDLYKKTVGVIGTGKIGSLFARIMNGFGCEVIAFDPNPNAEFVANGMIKYVSLEEIYRKSDVISLHVPLFPETKHMIDAKAMALMKPGVIIINTGRGALIDSHALTDALKSGRLGGAALDVYEEEEGVFFKDLSDQVLKDDTLVRLLSFPNVLLTSHQAFFTKEALKGIADITLQNISNFAAGKSLSNQVQARTHIAQVPK